jgi:hypothetical protein
MRFNQARHCGCRHVLSRLALYRSIEYPNPVNLSHLSIVNDLVLHPCSPPHESNCVLLTFATLLALFFASTLNLSLLTLDFCSTLGNIYKLLKVTAQSIAMESPGPSIDGKPLLNTMEGALNIKTKSMLAAFCLEHGLIVPHGEG